MEAELDQVDGRPIIGPERRLECLIAESLKALDPRCSGQAMGLPISQRLLQTGHAIFSGWYTGTDLGEPL